MTKILKTVLLAGMSFTMMASVPLSHAASNAPDPASVQPAAGQSDSKTEGAKNFISGMGDKGINFLGDTSMTMQAKQDAFRKLLNDSFDMNTIARFTLGQYWRTATPAQQQEYLQLFNEMIINVYSKRFSDYKGQKFEVRSARPENNNDVLVNSFIIPQGGQDVRVDWRVRNKGGAYRVVDILVEGVSMAQTQRADFASVIQRGGGKVEVLLDYMRKQ